MTVFTLERFSVECHKTKTKVITLTNHNRRGRSNEPLGLNANVCSRRQGRENARSQVTIAFGLTSEWLRK